MTLNAEDAVAWRRRVMSSLVNTFVGRGNWRLALGLLEDLGKEQCSTGASAAMGGTGDSSPPVATDDALRVDVLSRIGRVFLQFGSLQDAEVYFRRAEEAAAAEGAKEDNPRVSQSSCSCPSGTSARTARVQANSLTWFYRRRCRGATSDRRVLLVGVSLSF